jgi:predicted RNA polymerase sigma factor
MDGHKRGGASRTEQRRLIKADGRVVRGSAGKMSRGRGFSRSPGIAPSISSAATSRYAASWTSSKALPRRPTCEQALGNDELAMMFMCCHPSLPHAGRIALTLKTVGGFGVAEIAAAFLAEPDAIAQRLVRAKRQIREQEIAIEIPRPDELGARLESVLDVLYRLFNEGYAAHGEAAGDKASSTEEREHFSRCVRHRCRRV